MKDPYKVLGVDRKASQDDIKNAYRKLAKKLHPDLNPGNEAIEQQFKEVSQAYGLLSDPKTRAKFDRGEIDASGQETGPRGGFYRSYAEGGRGEKYQPFEFGEEISVEDIFSEFLGGARMRGGRRRRAPQRGPDINYAIKVSFEDAATGATKRIRLSDGKTLDVKIPAGTEDKQVLRLKQQGHPGKAGGPTGDALIEVEVEPHPHFKREGLDIRLELPVSLQEVVLGATVPVPTIKGKVTMKVPPGSNTDTTLRLKGKGIHVGNQTGDQLVMLKIMLPDRQDAQLEDFVKRWAGFNAFDPRKKAGLD